MLNLPRFLFINGPSGSGKTTLARLICEAQGSAYRESFAEPIRQMLYNVFFFKEDPFAPTLDLRKAEVKKSRMPFQEDLDEKGASDADYITIRDEMIAFSEEYMKRRYGDRIFGKLLFARCEEQSLFYSSFVIDDNGFAPEAQFIVDKIGADSCILLRLHRDGCNFSGDSRGYVDLPKVQTIELQNSGSSPKAMLDDLQLKLGIL